MNNIIWIFEKIWNQILFKSDNIFQFPYKHLREKTFYNEKIWKLIHHKTKLPMQTIQDILTPLSFQKRIIYPYLKNRLNLTILFCQPDAFQNLLEETHPYNTETIRLLVINGRLEMLKLFLERYPQIKITGELLFLAVETAEEEIYFFLRARGLNPNLSIYEKATKCSLRIIKDIHETIHFNKKILFAAFQGGNREIIKFLMDEAHSENQPIPPEFLSYVVIEKNLEALDTFFERQPDAWGDELFYAALLSGSMEMVKWAENMKPEIHYDWNLDKSHLKKGKKSPILEDITYLKNGKTYFSHTMNYAIQSKNLEIVQYIYSLGYGVTLSNIITCLTHSTIEILSFVASKYQVYQTTHQENQTLPGFILYYFGFFSLIENKLEKALVLYQHRLLPLSVPEVHRLHDQKKDSFYYQLSLQTENADMFYDEDYLLQVSLFFPNLSKDYKIASLFRFYLYARLDYTKFLTILEPQLASDLIFLFGDVSQIVLPMLPQILIIMEIVCYYQIPKIAYLWKNNYFQPEIIEKIAPVFYMLADPNLNNFLEKWNLPKTHPKYSLLSGCGKIDYPVKLDWEDFKKIILNVETSYLFKISIKREDLQRLISFCNEYDLPEIKDYYST